MQAMEVCKYTYILSFQVPKKKDPHQSARKAWDGICIIYAREVRRPVDSTLHNPEKGNCGQARWVGLQGADTYFHLTNSSQSLCKTALHEHKGEQDLGPCPQVLHNILP